MDATDLKLFKISNGALKGDALPTRLKIFAWGANETIDGPVTAGPKTGTNLAETQRKLGYERVAIDFDHCTVSGTKTNKELTAAGQPPLIFGYGRVHPIPGDGIYLEDVTWTPLGVQHARNFEDLSPAIAEAGGEISLIHSVALTPNGKVTGLQFFSATQPKTPMPKKLDLTQPLTGLTLCTLFGLAETATPEDLTARIGQLTALSATIKLDQAGKITDLPGLIADGKLTVLSVAGTQTLTEAHNGLVGRVKTLEDAGTKAIATLSATIAGQVKTFSAEDLVKVMAKVDALETKLTNTETAALNAERDGVIRSFAADGKVPKKPAGGNYSAEELKALPVDTLRILHANTPVTVPLSARHHGSATEGDKPKSYKDASGKIDLAGMFNDENAQAGA